MAYDNYVFILEVEPSTKDWEKIQAAINKKKSEWLRQKSGTGVRRATAAQYLKEITKMEEVLREPSKRQKHAKEAREILAKREEEKRKKLDELIAMIPAGGTIDEKGVIDLAKRAGGLTESEVRKRLKKRNISVEGARKPDGAPERRPKLDPTIANRIKERLDFLGDESLYAFLGLSPTNSQLDDLLSAAAKEYKRLEDSGRSDPETDVRRELAGMAKAVFQDADMKERYDNSRAVERMRDLQNQLEIAGRDRVLDDFEVRELLTQATKKGVGRNIALEYIEEYAQKRKWVVQRGTQGPADELMVCGFCDSTARSKNAKKCNGCGEDLIQACPICGTPTPTQDKCCGYCGCSTGARGTVRRMFHKGEALLKNGELDAADACFEGALEYWPGWKEAEAGKEQVAAKRLEKRSALNMINNLIQKRKLQAAQNALDGLKPGFVSGRTRDWARRVKEGLATARSAFREGQSLRRQGKDEAAVERFMAALDSCVDFDAAKSALALIAPAPVRTLKVKIVGSTARLKWTTPRVRGQVKYRVLRKKGGAPNGPDDGKEVAEVAVSSYDDVCIQAGQVWYYAVFAVRGTTASAGVISGPHVRLAEVSRLGAEAGDGQVILHWKRPRGCVAVEVWRARRHAPRAGRGTRVEVSGDSVVDQGLKNGALCLPRGGLLSGPCGWAGHAAGVGACVWRDPHRAPASGRRRERRTRGAPVSITSRGRTQTTLNTQGAGLLYPRVGRRRDCRGRQQRTAAQFGPRTS